MLLSGPDSTPSQEIQTAWTWIGPRNLSGQPHGRGRFLGPSGIVDEGEFVNGKEQGVWLRTTPGGDRLQGQYRDGGCIRNFEAFRIPTVASVPQVTACICFSCDGAVDVLRHECTALPKKQKKPGQNTVVGQ